MVEECSGSDQSSLRRHHHMTNSLDQSTPGSTPAPGSSPGTAPNIAILGATGVVGRELLGLLEERGFPHGELRLLASPRSAGQTIDYRGEPHIIQPLGDSSFDDIHIAFFCASGDVSREHAPRAVAAGAIVIDNASAFRMHDDVPLVLPEVNGHVLEDFRGRGRGGVIANANCSTIIALMAVAPLHRAARVKRMVISTYQAASGGGKAMLEELEQQAHDHAAGRPYTIKALDRPYLFNLFSHDSPIGPDGYNAEETKIVCETHKILDDDSIAITATCVRVPVLRCHCESINLTFESSMSEDEAREILAAAPGVRIVDDREANQFPEPAIASGGDDVLVGRIRGDISQPPGKGLDLFVAGDQLRKGAALNAVQIAEILQSRSARPCLVTPQSG